jgi:hypothetical protein
MDGMRNKPIITCRHILGTINGYCISCGQPIIINHRKFDEELRRMLTKDELEIKVIEDKELCLIK